MINTYSVAIQGIGMGSLATATQGFIFFSFELPSLLTVIKVAFEYAPSIPVKIIDSLELTTKVRRLS